MLGYKKLNNIFFILFTVFCVQFTELKLDVIKLSELLLLLSTPFIYRKMINKWSFYFLFLITLWFLITIFLNPFREFYLLEGVSVLKTPYLITIGRFLELFACINLMTFIIVYFKNKTKLEILLIIKYIFKVSIFLTIFNTIIYGLLKFNIINESNLFYIDNGIRMKGWYVEGGPYGLMLSFTYVLSYFFKSKYHYYNRFFLILVIFFLAKSKAGFLLIIIWYVIIYYKKAYEKLRELNIIVIIIGGLLMSLVIIKLGDKYIDDIIHVKREMKERPNDVNLVMGRIAGLFIFTKMVKDNPVFGIGLGNYPIIRNNPNYLEFIPKSPSGKTDAHGFGGLIQLLVDGGIVILSLFFFIIYSYYKKIKYYNSYYVKYLQIFLFFFVFGVQIYFLYPWVLLGIIISLTYKEKENETISN